MTNHWLHPMHVLFLCHVCTGDATRSGKRASVPSVYEPKQLRPNNTVNTAKVGRFTPRFGGGTIVRRLTPLLAEA